ncbi:hypothetical protein KQI63_06975 [bacterium]|nr:hypothetical protein [bacterium]
MSEPQKVPWWRSDDVILATITGICLVVKVFVIRRLLGGEIEVNDILIPPILTLVYSTLRGVLKSRKVTVRFKWDHLGYWSFGIVATTLVSILPYVWN